MCKFACCVLRVCVCCGVIRTSAGCFQCFVTPEKGTILCTTYAKHLDKCFEYYDELFNHNPQVIEAGKVGKGYDNDLKTIMASLIDSAKEDLKSVPKSDAEFRSWLKTTADNFIAKASLVSRATGCIPPCGYQTTDGHYSCVTCKYDSCGLPLDCPVQNISVEVKNSTQMFCDPKFPLPTHPTNIRIWKFAAKVKTQQMELFGELARGEDNLYSISSTRPHHEGTYQCEIIGEMPIVRIYYYLAVTQTVVKQSELLEIFELSLLPEGRLRTGPPPSQSPPPLVLIAICFTSLLLLLFLSLRLLFLWKKRGTERTGRI
ncbi:sperm acrosome membrane-associated protein 6-like isoform X1 [Stigmatopora argus]